MQSEQQHPEAPVGSDPSGPTRTLASADPWGDETLQVDTTAEPEQLDEQPDSDQGQQHDGQDEHDQVLVLESWQVALPATGDDQVDAALARLADVEGLAPAGHPELYDAVHSDLRAALADLDQG